MKIQTLVALLRIEALGSIRAAAAALHVSQPALTQAIQQLEEELGAQLLIRSPSGIAFTEYGRSVLRHARLMVSETQRVKEEIAQMRGDGAGHIRLAASPAISLSLLPQALRPFTRKFPQVRVHCIDGVSPMVHPALRSGAIDFALTPVRADELETGLVAEWLCEREIVVAAHCDNPHHRARSLAELVQARWVHATPSNGPGAAIDALFLKAGLEPPTPVMVCESLLALPEIVRDTDFVTTLPEALFQRVKQSHGLRQIELSVPLPKLQIAILRMEHVPLTPVAQELLGWVRQAAQA
ncbi:MAG: LysR family transcriptional regulator [Hylemonella sp.]